MSLTEADLDASAWDHPLAKPLLLADLDARILACIDAPDDAAVRKHAITLLGDLTRYCCRRNHLPPDAMARFLRFFDALPAYRGQGDAAASLDRGSRADVVAAMADAVAEIHHRARNWAADLDRCDVEARHLFLFSLPYSGASAIVPVLADYLAAEGFVTVTDGAALPAALAEAEARGQRVFAWFHGSHDELETFARRKDAAIVFLHRDFRDVIVSAVAGHEPTPVQMFAAVVGYRLDECFADSSPFWLALADCDPLTRILTFDSMKADVAGCAAGMIAMLGLSVDETRVQQFAASHSFEARTGRKEGAAAIFQRQGPYVFRKGTSGQWRERFDRKCVLFFAAKYGHLLLACSWADNMNWIDEVQG